MEDKKSISVVMVSYYTGSILFESISSVLRQNSVHQLIVVNNGNPDSVLASIERRFSPDKRFELIHGHGNIGFSKACNLAAEQVTGDLLLLLNPDCIIPDNGIPVLLEAVKPFKGKWLVSPRLINLDGTEQKGVRREILTPWIAFVEGIKLYKILPNHPYFKRFDHHVKPLPNKVSKIPITSGACMLIKTSVYRELGGMDEGYFLHVEDIDFCLRFRQSGGEIYFCPKITFVHALGTSKVSRLFIEWHKLVSMKRYFKKHFMDIYPYGFIPMVNLLLFVRFGMIAIKESFSAAVQMIKNQKKEKKVLNN